MGNRDPITFNPPFWVRWEQSLRKRFARRPLGSWVSSEYCMHTILPARRICRLSHHRCSEVKAGAWRSGCTPRLTRWGKVLYRLGFDIGKE